MILLDERVGSVHYASYLGERCVVTRLESGDAAFAGADGIMVGVEIKKILDAVNCMFSGRLADHQIPAMRQQYDVAYLVLEGLWQPSAEGLLQVYKGELGKWGRWQDATSGRKRLMYSQFIGWLSTLQLYGGIRLLQAPDAKGTAALIEALSVWWQRVDHKSFEVMHEWSGNTAALSRPTILRRIAACLPHVGWIKSAAVAEHFKSVKAMANSDEVSWQEVEGIGKVIAKQVVEIINGGEYKE